MLKLIYGRSGSGKTEYIHTILGNAADVHIPAYLIVPDQFTFAEEKRMLELFGEAKASRIKVFSFSRLAEEIFMTYGGISEKRIDDNGKLILMTQAIAELKDQLEFYGDSDVSELMCSAVTDFKSCGIDPGQLRTAALSLDGSFRDKIIDIALIYETYEAMLDDKFIESGDILTRLGEILERNNYFSGAVVCFDDFESFSRQKLRIVNAIMAQADTAWAAFCTDGSAENELSFFLPSDKAARSLRASASENGVSCSKPLLFEEEQRYVPSELLHLEANILRDDPEVFTEEPENIEIFEGETVYDEAEFVSAEIRRLVYEDGYRYGDFTVISREPDKYANIFMNAFDRREIPCYISKAYSADSDPLIRLVTASFDVIASGFRTEDILKVLKTGLGPLDTAELSALENYVYIWKISGKAWKEDFLKDPEGYNSRISDVDSSEKLVSINASRRKAIEPLVHFAESVHETDVRGLCEAVFELLSTYGADKTIVRNSGILNRNGHSELGDAQKKTWKYLMNILDQFCTSIGDTAMSAAEFSRMAEKIFARPEMRDIPERHDTVIFGAPEQVLQSEPKICFVTGLIQGEFPASPEGRSVFSDRERNKLSELELELEDNLEDRVLLEKYMCYRSASAASEKVYFSCYLSDGRDDYIPSELIESVMHIFPDIRLKRSCSGTELAGSWASAFSVLAKEYKKNTVLSATVEELMEKNDVYAGRLSSLRRIADNENFEIKDKNISSSLFGERFISASQIDVYHHCRFQYFCKYGLNIRERKPAEINVLEYGTLMHYLFEHILRTDLTRYKSSEALEKDISMLIKSYADENMGGFDNMSERDKYRFKRMCDTAVMLIEHMMEELSVSKFKPEYFELMLGKESDFPALDITTEMGNRISVGGIVDRADIYDSGNGRYVRVVDYKTGKKEFKLSDVLYGLNLQMLIYLAAMTQSGEYIPAGVLYMPSAMPGVSAAKGMTAEKIRAEKDKKMRMNGAVLSDEEIIKAMEAGAEGKFIPVGIKASGDLIRPENAYSDEQLHEIFDYAKKLVSTMADSLVRGDIAAEPLMTNCNSCSWCPYASICGKSADENSEKNIKMTKKDILDMMNGKGGEQNAKA